MALHSLVSTDDSDPYETPPAYWNWCNHIYCSPAKSQGQCRSAWAHAVIGAVETQAAMWLNLNVSLSSQMLIDCDEKNKGCLGGYSLKAYQTLLKYNGSVFESDYEDKPGHQGKCEFTNGMKMVPVLGYSKIPPDEKAMKYYLYRYGPLVAAMNGGTLKNFKANDIFTPDKHTCRTDHLDHAVLIVGYGTQHDHLYKESIDYWILKNSWGEDWKEDGYFRMKRNHNHCGIANDVSIPIIPVFT